VVSKYEKLRTRKQKKGASPELIVKKEITLAIHTDEEVTCKICGSNSTQKKLKSHLCTERNLDVDLRPRQIFWSVKGQEGMNPAYFFMYTCPHCYFTAAANIFENPFKGLNIPVTRFKSRVENGLLTDPVVQSVFELTRTYEDEKDDLVRAIKLHLLAIFQLRIDREIEDRNSLSLGRYCLRLAWLYEDLEDNPDLKNDMGPQVETLMAALRARWPGVPNTIRKAHQEAIRYYSYALEHSRAIESVKEEVDLQLLISRIALKVGDIALATRFLGRAKERVRKADNDRRMGKTGNDGQIAADIRRMRVALDAVQIVFEKLRDARNNEQEAKARRIVEENPGKAAEELRKMMAAQHLDQRAIDTVLPSQQKKKGIFGGFFEL